LNPVTLEPWNLEPSKVSKSASTPPIRRFAALGLVGILGGSVSEPRLATLGAQAPSAEPAFDVASVKVNRSGDWRKSIGPAPGGRFMATNQTLRELMPFAYGLPQVAANIRIIGGPAWIDSDRFDIVAKTDGTPTPQEMGAMLRTLLKDRFKLSAHNETRHLPIYTLVTTTSRAELGPRLRRSEVSEAECAVRRAAIRRREPVPPQPPGKPPVCGSGRTVPGRITAVGWPMEQLGSALTAFAGRVVLERTALSGLFDFDLEWTPDQLPRQPPDDPDPPRIDPNGPSLFTALHEQLGLKLESTKGPVDVLVVDRADKPTED
jgi:uncharacterized protein (TIGR03435 family)